MENLCSSEDVAKPTSAKPETLAAIHLNSWYENQGPLKHGMRIWGLYCVPGTK